MDSKLVREKNEPLGRLTPSRGKGWISGLFNHRRNPLGTGMMSRNWIRNVAVAGVVAGCLAAPSSAQPKIGEDEIKKARQLEKETKESGPWEVHQQVLDQAADNIFEQQGWDSEEDLYARDMIHELHKIPPWNPKAREERFLDMTQVRYSLTHDQRINFGKDIRREATMLTMKHFKTLLPIAMEAMQTRLKQDPFTPEQVQRWSRSLKPVMDDSLQMVRHVSDRLKSSMTKEQRKRLDADLKALMKRHKDFEKQMEKWRRGKWDPRDWGLQDDPVHQAAVAEVLARDARRNALVEQKEAQQASLRQFAKPRDESTWEKYVRLFCRKYKCTDLQRSQALAILRSSQKEAIAYRLARREEIERIREKAEAAESEEQKGAYQAQLAALEQPIERIFDRMCRRLKGQVLTSQQRLKLKPADPKVAAN